jgi:hypothetical protein
VSAGARSQNGLVIGVRPGDSAADANPDLSAVVVTNMGDSTIQATDAAEAVALALAE